MIPILYSPDETLFRSNGIGRLVDCVSCEVTEERNGVFECEFKYPVTGQHYADIELGSIIYATHDDTREPQPFDVYKRSAPIDGIVTFNARHISYRLNNIIVRPFEADTCQSTLAAFRTEAITTNPFQFYSNKSVTASFKLLAPASVRSLLGGSSGSVLDVFGTGEYKYDKFTVYFYLHRGAEKPITIRYGKNLTSVQQDLDDGEGYNTVVPYWLNGETLVTAPEWVVASGKGYGKVTKWTSGTTPMTTENGEELEFTYIRPRIVTMDMSSSFENQPTPEALANAAYTRLRDSDAWAPSENVKVDFVEWWQMGEYENVAPLQEVNLCDTVSVVYPALGIETKQKVIKTVYDSLLDRYTSIELGKPQQSFADLLLTQADAETVVSPEFQSVLEKTIARATRNLIEGNVGSHVILHTNDEGATDEIYILDAETASEAVNVIRMNAAGIGFSHNGLNGPFTSAWTIDGTFFADYITAGTMSADRIRTGLLQANNSNSYWNLDDGVFQNYMPQTYVKIAGGNVSIGIGQDYSGEDIEDKIIGRLIATTSQNHGYGPGLFAVCDTEDTTSGTIVFGSYSEPLDSYQTIMRLSNDQSGIQIRKATFFNGNNIYLTEDTNGPTLYGYEQSGDSSEGIIVNARGKMTMLCNSLVVASYTYTPPSGFSNYFGSATYFNTTVSALTVTQRSDARLKDVVEYDDRLDGLIDKLDVKTYRWKDGDDNDIHVGLIAQEVQKALEDLGIEDSGIVSTRSDYLGLNYFEIAMLLIRKVQAQQKRIDELESRLERIERLLNGNS